MSADPSVTPLPAETNQPSIVETPDKNDFASVLNNICRLMAEHFKKDEKKIAKREITTLVKKELDCSTVAELVHFVTHETLTSAFWTTHSTASIRFLFLCNKYLKIKGATIDDTTTWTEIYAKVAEAETTPMAGPNPTLAAAQIIEATLSSLNKKETVIEKNTIAIPAFSGKEDDWNAWKLDVLVALGKSGCHKFLEDETLVATHPKDAEKVWFSLVEAIKKGTASSIVRKSMNQKNPMDVWKMLLEIYDADLSEDSELMSALKGLFTLRLTDPLGCREFVNEFEQYLEKLQETKSAIAEDHQALRCILVLALQHPDYRIIQSELNKSSNLTIHKCLKMLTIEGKHIMYLHQHQHGMSSDGLSSVVARRTQTRTQKAGTSDNGTDKLSSFPRLPDILKNKVSRRAFKLLLEWRRTIMSDLNIDDQALQSKCNEKWESLTQDPSPSDSHRKRSPKPKRHALQQRTARRSKTLRGEEDSESDGEAADPQPDDEDDDAPTDKKPPATPEPSKKRKTKETNRSRAVRLRRFQAQEPPGDVKPPPGDVKPPPVASLRDQDTDLASTADMQDEDEDYEIEPTTFVRFIRRGPTRRNDTDVSRAPTLLIDSAADQALAAVGPQGKWRVASTTGRYVLMIGPLAGRMPGERFEVGTVMAKIAIPGHQPFIAVIHEALLDTDSRQTESLVTPFQIMKHGGRVCITPKHHLTVDGHLGRQKMLIDGRDIPLSYDGAKCFLTVEYATNEDLQQLPHVEFTSPLPYEPMERIYTRRLPKSISGISLDEWRANLGYAPLNVVKRTLTATTQMVKTVECEVRDRMRDHIKARLVPLRPNRINDALYSDTFFSSVRSVRNYTCFQMFALRDCQHDTVVPMRAKSQAAAAYADFIRNVGAPAICIRDGSAEQKSDEWTSISRRFCIEDHWTEPDHPNQNLAERRGGDFKADLLKLLFETGAPDKFWCYAADYLSLVRNVRARKRLNWRTPSEMLDGETPDISVFRIPFWHPVWYYTPKASFPKQKMQPGRMLGIAPRVGDGFCYHILVCDPTTGDYDRRHPKILVRSVVRRRSVAESDPPIVETDQANLKLSFLKADGTPLPDWSYHEDIDEDGATESLTPSVKEERTLPDIRESDLEYDADSASAGDEYDSDAASDMVGDEHASAAATNTGGDEDSEPPSKRQKTDGGECVDAPTAPINSDVTSPDEHSASTPQRASATLPTSHSSVSQTLSENPSQTEPSHERQGEASPEMSSDLMDQAEGETDGEESDQIGTDFVSDLYNHFNAQEQEDRDFFHGIVGHKWCEGRLLLRVKLTCGEDEYEWIPFETLKGDEPFALAEYIVKCKIDCPKSGHNYKTGRYTRWARGLLRDVKRSIRRIHRLNGTRTYRRVHDGRPIKLTAVADVCQDTATTLPDLDAEDSKVEDPVSNAAAAIRVRAAKRKKPGRNNRHLGEIKYGVKVPRSVKEALLFDKENGNKLWEEAIKKEMGALIALGVFNFKAPAPTFKPASDYQFAPLRMIFDVKADYRRKARLVAGGHVIDPRGLNTYASVVKGVTVRLLDLIAHRDGLTTLCGDVGNAFVNASTKEKVYCCAGPEFGDREGCIVLIKKALYGLKTSAERWRAHFADFLRGMGFVNTSYDRNVWMRAREEKDGYDYICTHVDDFKIVARNPSRWMEQIKGAFLIKDEGPPKYYLGNDYYQAESGIWYVGCFTYVKESIRKLEEKFGTLGKSKTPLPVDCHPEQDTSPLLADDGHRDFQMLIGMAQWASVIGRMDITHAVASLSRFSAAPREMHLRWALQIFGYLKQYPNKRIAMDSRDLIVDEALITTFESDFSAEYPDAVEEIDQRLPKPIGRPLTTAVFCDSDHAHDTVTRRSITGIFVFVGRTPVNWISRRQGAIASSTYAAEFMAMRTATEEAIAIRYMLRCLGVPVDQPTRLYGDNLGVILNAACPDSQLKKKHVAISYHSVREAVAAGVVEPVKIDTKDNFADICTKQINRDDFIEHVHELMSSGEA